MKPFSVALSGDFLGPNGTVGWGDIGLNLLEQDPAVAYHFLDYRGTAIEPDQLVGIDALILLLPRVDAEALTQADDLKLIARFGVGYDNLDVPAITAHGTAVTLTRAAVRRAVATAALTLMLALSHRVLDKDRLTRTGGWAQKLDFMGTGLTGKTVGYVGWGNTGSGLTELLQPFATRQLAYDPWAKPHLAKAQGVELVDLSVVARESDFVVIMAALTESSRGLVDVAFLRKMKRSAFIINVARGPIIVTQDLAAALNEGRIAGAALDVFETEPVDPSDPVLTAKNTLLSPHATSWTDESAISQGSSVMQAVLDVAYGRRPRDVLNPAVFNHERLRFLS